MFRLSVEFHGFFLENSCTIIPCSFVLSSIELGRYSLWAAHCHNIIRLHGHIYLSKVGILSTLHTIRRAENGLPSGGTDITKRKDLVYCPLVEGRRLYDIHETFRETGSFKIEVEATSITESSAMLTPYELCRWSSVVCPLFLEAFRWRRESGGKWTMVCWIRSSRHGFSQNIGIPRMLRYWMPNWPIEWIICEVDYTCAVGGTPSTHFCPCLF